MYQAVILTQNKPGFSESGKAGGRGDSVPFVTSLFEGQWPRNLVVSYHVKTSTSKLTTKLIKTKNINKCDYSISINLFNWYISNQICWVRWNECKQTWKLASFRTSQLWAFGITSQRCSILEPFSTSKLNPMQAGERVRGEEWGHICLAVLKRFTVL